jgi:excisionase family DNA binding protein
MDDDEELMTPKEAGGLFRVDPKTTVRWAKRGKLRYIRTLGGHHRFYASQVRALLAAGTTSTDLEMTADEEDVDE